MSPDDLFKGGQGGTAEDVATNGVVTVVIAVSIFVALSAVILVSWP